MRDLILRDERQLSPIQRHIVFCITSFFASVYRNAYVFEHLDFLLYQEKSLRLMIVSNSTNDFDTLSDPDSDQRRLLLELPRILSNTTSVGGFREDITPNIANEI